MTRIRSFHAASLAVSIFLSTVAAAGTPLDTDHDGLSDRTEQKLLEQFRPAFMISATDCAVRPSRFEPGQKVPTPVAADGTIYGQVSPHGTGYVEIHYYTFWNRDCGRMAHPLDAEHVSALVDIRSGSKAHALYWYAGAHENTACDISSGARAGALAAQQHGPVVWSSLGKHALYLRKSMCGQGCGADSCSNDVALAQNGAVINVGEPGAPANGAVWAASPQWAAASKMDSDFPANVIAALDATSGDTIVTLRGSSSVRGTIQGSEAVLAGTKSGARHTGTALDTADDHTSRSLGKAVRATGRSLQHAWNFVFRHHEAR
ncbi:MAG: hypothetical protein ACM3SW_11195 [Actinomycetota bacterium]